MLLKIKIYVSIGWGSFLLHIHVCCGLFLSYAKIGASCKNSISMTTIKFWRQHGGCKQHNPVWKSQIYVDKECLERLEEEMFEIRGHQDRKKVPRVDFFSKASRGELTY